VVGRQPAVDLLGEDGQVSAQATSSTRRTTRTRAVALLLAALVGTVAGCSSDQPEAKPTTTAPTAAPTAAPAPPPHACYTLDFAQALKPTSTAAPVPCTSPHTTTTIRVGTIRPVVDGHLLAVDSDTVQQQIASRCRAAFAKHVGGDEETRRLSRLTVVWFSPSLTESDRGALWFRCDLVALEGHDQLVTLPRSTRSLLSADDALDRFGTCGTASPASPRFERVICSQPHSWRARATVALPAGAAYLGKAAGAAADSTCRDTEARLAADILTLRWSFEWPTREQWDAGQRYGYCWTPDPA
jgi:putative regulator of septum formation